MESVAAASTPDAPALANRTVTKRAGAAGLASVFVVPFIPHVWVGIGMIFAAIGQCAFPFVATPVDGVVTGVNTGTGKHGVFYTETVRYSVDGKDGTETISIDAARFRAKPVNEVVHLRAANMLGFAMAHREGESDFPVLVPFALFWNTICAVFVWQLAVKPLLRWWLVRRGALVRGVVDDVHLSTGKGARALVKYTFTPAGSTLPMRGSMSVTPSVFQKAGEAFAVGADVAVVHHPRRPRLNALVDLTSWQPVD
ncbi:MAG TPA: hypothetical protein VGO62_16340 [Myxococcota bacterium]|jgi:hypothetical protein